MSTLIQLLDHYNEIIETLREGSNVGAINLDFAKTLDKVDQNIVLTKLDIADVERKVFEGIKYIFSTQKPMYGSTFAGTFS